MRLDGLDVRLAQAIFNPILLITPFVEIEQSVAP
jgi:hypothetical protein